jgi:hypothetical protein
MLLHTCGNAEIIEQFSIRVENEKEIYIKDSEQVGRVIKSVSDEKLDVKIVDYKGQTYFVKPAPLLELSDTVGSIIASCILNKLFKDNEKRYPLLNLAFNPDYLSEITMQVEPFRLLSPKLEGFISIADLASNQSIKKAEIKVDDIEKLYMGLYLVGGGDPHMHNIFYNLEDYHLGDVDLDVTFKAHISYFDKNKEKFKKTHSDLAIKTINCTDIFANFLFTTDSYFNHKINWGYYNKGFPLYQKNLKMSGSRLCQSTNILKGTFPDKDTLYLSVVDILNELKKGLKDIINKKLQLDNSKEKSIFDDSGYYFDKNSDTYNKHKENKLIKAVTFLFDQDEHYIEKIYQFIENRCLTLNCVFNKPDIIGKEMCEKCLQNISGRGEQLEQKILIEVDGDQRL